MQVPCELQHYYAKIKGVTSCAGEAGGSSGPTPTSCARSTCHVLNGGHN